MPRLLSAAPRGTACRGLVGAEGGGAPAASQCHGKPRMNAATGCRRVPGECLSRVGGCGGRRGTGCKPVPRKAACRGSALQAEPIAETRRSACPGMNATTAFGSPLGHCLSRVGGCRGRRGTDCKPVPRTVAVRFTMAVDDSGGRLIALRRRPVIVNPHPRPLSSTGSSVWSCVCPAGARQGLKIIRLRRNDDD